MALDALTIPGSTMFGILLCVLSLTQLLIVSAALAWLKSSVVASAAYSLRHFSMKSADKGSLTSDHKPLAMESFTPLRDASACNKAEADSCRASSLKLPGTARA